MLAAGLIFGGLGCNAITGTDIQRQRQPAWIRFHNDPPRIDLPSSVAHGVDFEVTVRTYGGGCVEQGDMEVEASGNDAELRPFDVHLTHLPSDYPCIDILRHFAHRATLRFAEAGVGTIRVRGREEPGGRELVVERLILVR
jgi:hypothetical protein